jgi:ADP-heptose:LPS heptosyltransferase/GT2 family glycosyltransferase
MLVTISVACYNQSALTKRCINSIRKHTSHMEGMVEFIFSDNASHDDTPEVLEQLNVPNKRIIRYGKNTGFGFPHNEALKIAKGHYFLSLNNDIVIEEDDWILKLIKPLEDDASVALVGLDGTPASLTPDGYGTRGTAFEYVEASCIVGRTKQFKEYGLYSPTYEMFLFEDSDMSLRYRQMGFKIARVKIRYQHNQSSTLNTIDPQLRGRITHKNSEVFMNRWRRYLVNREFSNKILVRCESDGIGDVLCATPVFEGLRRDHPTAEIVVQSNHAEVFTHNPFVTRVINRVDARKSVAWDRVIDIRPNFGKYAPMWKQAAHIASTAIVDQKPTIYMKKKELEKGYQLVRDIKLEAGEDALIVACSLMMNRANWQGRNWRLEYAQELIEILNQNGFVTVEVGAKIPSTGKAHVDLINKTTLRELFSVMANIDVFIGIDSLPMHIAQAFDKPSYILFGATEPVARVTDFTITYPIRNEGLPCLGCYQRKGSPLYNRCELGYEACMQDLTPDLVAHYILNNDAVRESNIIYLHDYIGRKGFEI